MENVGTTLLYENDRVRVWEMLLPPGATCEEHRHRHDYLMLYAEPSRIGATLDDGRPVIQHLDAGMVAYRAVGAGTPPHAITNLGDRPSHHFVVELLDANEPEGRPPDHNGRGHTELRRADPGEPIGDRPQ